MLEANPETEGSAGEESSARSLDSNSIAIERAFMRSINIHGHDRVKWTREELVSMAERIKNATCEIDRLMAVHALACTGLRYMIKLANKYRRRTTHHMELPDVFSHGYLGLVRAAEDYDPEKGTFTTYATAWVHQHIRRAFLDQNRTVRIPANLNQRAFAFLRAWEAMRRELGREPLLAEVAEKVGIEVSEADRLRRILAGESSLDSVVTGGDGEEFRDPLVATLASSDDDAVGQLLEETEVKACLWAYLARLEDRERLVVIARFGLRDEDPKTLDELGEELDVSRERARQIEKEALAKLFKWMKSDKVALL